MTISDAPAETTKLTVEEFLAWAEQQPDGPRYELHSGEKVEMPPSKARQTVISARMIIYLGHFVEENGLGIVSSSDGGFIVSKEDFYAPDAAFYSKERLPDGVPDDDYFRVAPDLAVEVVSASDEHSAHHKARRYLDLGVRIVWVVYPKRRAVDVYTPTEGGFTVLEVKDDGTLTGGDILPGFELPVARLLG